MNALRQSILCSSTSSELRGWMLHTRPSCPKFFPRSCERVSTCCPIVPLAFLKLLVLFAGGRRCFKS
eukprot:1969583-Pleurochrysis_carterae.AAC.1